MGGIGAHEYMAPCPAGENDVALSDAGYAANVEIASATPAAGRGPARAPADAPQRVETPGRPRPSRRSPTMLGVPAGAIIKALPVIADGARAAARARARRPPPQRVQARATRSARRFRPAEEAEVRELFGTEPGFIGPIGARVPVLADQALQGMRGLVTGGNEPDVHLTGVEPGRDFEAEWVDVRTRRGGRHLPARRHDPASSPRSRSATSSSSARATRSRSGRATWTSRAASS